MSMENRVETCEQPEKTIRWRYYKSLHETTLAACFASSILDTNSHFIEIDRTEYEHLLRELQS